MASYEQTKKSEIIKKAMEVSSFLVERMKIARDLGGPDPILPTGDFPYATALYYWEERGKPRDAYFCFLEGEDPCPALIQFRGEVTKKFGLTVLSPDEAAKRKKWDRYLVYSLLDPSHT